MKYKFVAAWVLSLMFAFGVLTDTQTKSFGQNKDRNMRQGGQRGARGGQRGRRGGRNVDDGSSLAVGEVAPDFALKSLDGKSETKLSDFRGKKPVVLLFGSYT